MTYAVAPSPGTAPGGVPPIKPAWLRPAALVAVVAAHAIVAWLSLAVIIPSVTALDSIGVDLAPEGDFFESEEVAETEDTPPPEQAEQPDLAIPPPMVMAPDAPPLPAKREAVEKLKKKVVERKAEAKNYAKERHEAQMRRRLGAPEGSSNVSGMTRASYKGLLAAEIRRHTPAVTSLGEGTATVVFHVAAGGGIAGVSASGSTAAHAALARRIIGSVHAPPPPGGGFSASQIFHFR